MTSRSNDPVLILGGTSEARELAVALVGQGRETISSLAGRVKDPALPQGAVISGGFGGADGLATWLTANRCQAVVDATHPFAQRISANAVLAAGTTGTPLVRLQRPAWEPSGADRWTMADDIGAAAQMVGARGGRVFLTTGRQDVGSFAGVRNAWFLIRVVAPPEGDLPQQHLVLRSRGPYRLDDERQLLREHRIDLLVTKNSGGEHTRAKLRAAADAGIEVIVVRRPPVAPGCTQVASSAAALAWLDQVTGQAPDSTKASS
ncbi:cobalt-precorrin-6A reductase [Mycolicibacterium neoaurum]|uniref:cobalt-precorrin-6A reductase n=1 Tax=Mycolicibacterium neoaurum TaxID=1795 RepID=UPI0026741B6C|nr:cobalt-precorrin-6A reductase [Mycolicibacterium neoaurum]MDO3401606.1 cobalt-precorrin-6A reductase [Mycolicibacterium neoaurum]